MYTYIYISTTTLQILFHFRFRTRVLSFNSVASYLQKKFQTKKFYYVLTKKFYMK